jgi:hypothetical protein
MDDERVYMVSAASELLSFIRRNSEAIPEDVFQHMMDFIRFERIKEDNIKIQMIASATKAYELSKKNPKLTEKDIIRKFMEEIPGIIQEVNEKKYLEELNENNPKLTSEEIIEEEYIEEI